MLSLRQSIEPAEPEDLAAVDTGILDDAAGLMDSLIDGLAIGKEFVTGLEKFVPVLSGFLDRLQKL